MFREIFDCKTKLRASRNSDKAFFYFSVGDLEVNAAAESCRAVLRIEYGSEPDEPIVIRFSDGKAYLKANCYDDPKTEYEMHIFYSEDDIVFLCEDDSETIVLRLN